MLILQETYSVFFFSRVIAIDIDDKKLELAKEMGAEITFNSKKQDLKQVYLSLSWNI